MPDRSQSPDLLRRLAGWLHAAQGGQAVPSLLADLVAALVEAFEALTRGDFDECTARCAAAMAALPEGERWVRGWAEWVMGLACWLSGKKTAAGLWLRDGLGCLAPFGDDLAAAQYLEAFAWLAAARGEHRRAAWLQGAADLRWRRLTQPGTAAVPRFGVALLHAERERGERTARDALGPAGYAAEHGAGAAMTGQDALRCALGELAAPPPRHQGHQGHQGEQGEQGQLALAAAAGHAGRWQLLTSREREVAVLVAQGMTNKDIAARLFVSKRTVDAHIEHILAKLAYGSRVQIAALVAYEQPVEEEPASHTRQPSG